jgi:hypothetical protein
MTAPASRVSEPLRGNVAPLTGHYAPDWTPRLRQVLTGPDPRGTSAAVEGPDSGP